MNELLPKSVKIDDRFWNPRLQVNTAVSIFHQWEMLEASGCIDNFRIAAGEKEGFRVGWFFADSDAFKWLDAASRIERSRHDAKLSELIDEFIALLGRAQMEDGYLFTYNQIHFPGQRWVNLQVEHELYCQGHLIEAGVSHYQATGREDMLGIARKAADLIVSDFRHAGPQATPGHEEIEIALLRLYEVTGQEPYRETALHFLEQRGRTPFFGISLARQFASNAAREKLIAKHLEEYREVHPGVNLPSVPAMNEAKKPPFSILRFFISGLNGKYFQQHRPIRGQRVPVGHAVRFGYLETAEAMMLCGKRDDRLLRTMTTAWERMVTRRMDVTGGLGALPDSEGFGRDYELNPEYAYNETCAGIASLYWNWKLACLTGEARYADLFEWQLYNSVLAGVGLEGKDYLYNNPTTCRGGITRRPWYSIPCCPSNISRTFADLGRYILTFTDENLWVHQYIGCGAKVGIGGNVDVAIESGLPFDGLVKLTISPKKVQRFTLHLRKPSWAGAFDIIVNGENIVAIESESPVREPTATGVDPRGALFLVIERDWMPGSEVFLQIEMPTRILRPHPKVCALRGRAAITRGPLVYCLENIDNPGVDIFDSVVDARSLEYEYRQDLLGGTGTLKANTVDGHHLLFIPYFLWGNRGLSGMTAWVRINE